MIEMIDSYKFGQIVIDKIPYEKDVLVFPRRVQSDWWRKEGHRLQLEDIQAALEESKPKVLVVGTGKFGIMKIDPAVRKHLEENDVVLHAEPTEKATKIYNRILLTEDKLLGAFHITC